MEPQPLAGAWSAPTSLAGTQAVHGEVPVRKMPTVPALAVSAKKSLQLICRPW